MNIKALALLLPVALLAPPALAHHTHAMFDFDKRVERVGTVKAFKWTNPHSWLHVLAADEKGAMIEYTLELGAPAALVSRGWKPTTVATGDKVTVRFFPTRDGGPGGSLMTIVLPDGKTLGQNYE